MIRATLSRMTRRFRRREDGTATIEFVIFVPTVVMIFMASVEAGFYMAKHVMLERGLDLVIRDVRLHNIPPTELNPAGLRARICDATPILSDCTSILKIEMRPVSMATFDMPTVPSTCVNRGAAAPPPDEDLLPGGSNELMMVRVCAVQDPIFPSTGIGLQLRADDLGGYQLAAASVYVNEPR
jgi:hypothetical protein